MASPYATLALLLGLLAVTLLRGFLPRGVVQARAEVAQHAEWSSALRPIGSGTGHQAGAAGSSVVQRATGILLGLVAALSFLRMLQSWVPSWAPPPSLATSSHSFSLPCDAGEAWQRASHALALVGQRITARLAAGDVRYASARRAGVAGWAPGLFYLGILTLLLAALVEGRFGWVGQPLELALGETLRLDEDGELTVRLELIELIPRQDGTMRRFNSQVSLIRGAQVERRLDLGLGKRATYRGGSLYQLGVGPAVRIVGRDQDGHALRLRRVVGDTSPQPELRVRFSGRQQEQLVVIPEADLIVCLVHYPSLPAQGITGRALHVQLRRGKDGRMLTERFLAQDGTVSAEGAEIGFAFEYYVALRAEREPALALAGAGGALILLGMMGFAFWPPRDLWLATRGDDGRTTGQLWLSHRQARAPWFLRLKATLGEGADE